VLSLDLRGTPCPLNFIRTRLALEKIAVGAWLQVDLDAGEPERMVREGIGGEGHRVEQVPLPIGVSGEGIRLLIRRHGG
jgi:TusA-related sulfurtransferase